MPSKNHAIVQGNLSFLLRKEYGATFRILPEVSIQFDSKERIPDIALYKSIEFTPGSDEIRLSAIPEVVIEILSPNQTLTELIEKSDLYFESGVPSYWLVIPDLISIYIFSEKNNYEVFSKKDMLIDKKAKIEIDLEEVFK